MPSSLNASAVLGELLQELDLDLDEVADVRVRVRVRVSVRVTPKPKPKPKPKPNPNLDEVADGARGAIEAGVAQHMAREP